MSAHIHNVVDEAARLAKNSKPVTLVVAHVGRIDISSIDYWQGSSHTIRVEDTAKRVWMLAGEDIRGFVVDKTQ